MNKILSYPTLRYYFFLKRKLPFVGPDEICIILFPNSVQFFPILNVLKCPFFTTYHNFTVRMRAARYFPCF